MRNFKTPSCILSPTSTAQSVPLIVCMRKTPLSHTKPPVNACHIQWHCKRKTLLLIIQFLLRKSRNLTLQSFISGLLSCSQSPPVDIILCSPQAYTFILWYQVKYYPSTSSKFPTCEISPALLTPLILITLNSI